ncbi:hypothetical protein [Bradyrhizobium sp. BR 1433]|uniref:hypothetical protein n=1 Tax=Bradyrhizobium sp. BR 1433 TaxID=3447967 RepID=UPI003EE75F42
MVTKIGEKDQFGYDDIGRPVVAQIADGTTIWGYGIASRIKSALSGGFEIGCHPQQGGGAIVYLFSPSDKATELWGGRWRNDPHGMSVINVGYLGVIAPFRDFAEARAFLQSGGPIHLRAEYLTVPGGGTQYHPDIVADRELALGLVKTPQRFPSSSEKVNRDLVPAPEREAADDIDFLVHNLFDYVFRFDAASKLMAYASTLHFSRPQFLPHSQAKYFITIEWQQMAARDAVFSLFHFWRTFEILRKDVLKHSPAVRDLADAKQLRLAWKLMASQFPNAIRMRNAIGHAGEFFSTTKQRERHSGQKNMFVEYVMMGNEFIIRTFGQNISLDVSSKSVERLERIKGMIVGALSAALAQARKR